MGYFCTMSNGWTAYGKIIVFALKIGVKKLKIKQKIKRETIKEKKSFLNKTNYTSLILKEFFLTFNLNPWILWKIKISKNE